MKEWRGKRIYKNKYKTRLFILLLLFSILPLSVLGGFAYRTYLDDMTKRVNSSMAATVEQVKNRLENTLTSIKQYYSEIIIKERIQWLMDEPSIHYQKYGELTEAQEILRGALYLNDYIGGYSFINLREGWVLSNIGMFPLEKTNNLQELEAFLQEEEQTRLRVYWSNHLNRTVSEEQLIRSRTIDISGYLLILKLPALTVYTEDLLVVNIKGAKLNNIIRENLSGYDICVFDTKGEKIFASNDRIFEYSRNQMLENAGGIYDLADEGTILLEDGTKHHIMVEKVSANGLIYVASYDTAGVSEGADRIVLASLIIILILVVVLLICRVFAGLLYKPIHNLTKYTQNIFGYEASDEDEFTYIAKGVGKLSDSKKGLEELVDSQTALLIELFMVRLIRGALTQEKIDMFLERYHLKMSKCYAVMAVLCIEDGGVSDELEMDAVYLTIAENMPESITQELFVHPFCQGDVILLVLDCDEEKQMLEKIREVHKQVTEYMEKTYHCLIAAGVSQIFHLLKHFRTAYNECMEALRNEGVSEAAQRENGSIAFYGDFAQNDNIRHGYDLTLEQSMRNAVDNCDKETAYQLIDQFVDGLNKKGASRHERSLYLHRFLIAIVMVPSNAGLSMNHIFGDKTVDVFIRFSRLYDTDKLKYFLKMSIVEPVIKELLLFRHSHSTDILDRVVALVKGSKGDITLKECAEQLNYHPSYIWKVLKAECNMTFTDFANLKKLETAKEMLVHTELSIADIAESLSYSNTQNFIRFFSKYVQMTPGRYRKVKQSDDNG